MFTDDYWSNDELPKTICAYFWSTLAYTTMGSLVFLAMGGLAVFFVSLIPCLLWSWLHNHSHQARDVFCVILGSAAVPLVCLGSRQGLDVLKERARKKAREKMWASREEPQPLTTFEIGLTMVKSFKEKVCPFIEYK